MISKFPPTPKAPPAPAHPVASSASYSDPRRTFQGGLGGFGSGAYGGKQQQQQSASGGQGDYEVSGGSAKAERPGRGDAQGEVGHEDLLALLGAVGGQGEQEGQQAEETSSETRQEGQGREETKAEATAPTEAATLDIGDVQALLSQVPLSCTIASSLLSLVADSERRRDVESRSASECKYAAEERMPLK
eukprot:765428-Hanusia_phi.AAC.2